ncbi:MULTISPECIES: L-rhamnose mutarotase [unclassified Microbacterium]|uniref:L-rhamnose mutarotase n=1 Tax=unclassified Microbacterium TaxID=2609290 RepID=UPI000CFD48DC|nr:MULTISPECIES: L-rhamnose mutarotase [unclassified Microbacterium]PQZ50933.1 hypothetical protein CQ032_18430 [Microbacterium sp. MYb43]PQZ72693.1 hypothetical protein CQ031_18380 [Microbacterium sp. MYb40]PRB16461.1 hypothetical protein CQ040_18420 [Microbacterium sp. MYb54]PRB31665.1 hypothetical protein CQ037_01730 [Microbacterium sp. MYb50]PRB67718.1 hypothetical protein CQ027_18270 [Microbacterium sp. MYb32]
MITVGRRTRIRPGHEADYARIHARVPEAVASAIHRSGVVRWHIWLDGSTLFHSIDTTAGYAAFLDEIGALGPVDPAWDAVIADLLESGPDDDRVLELVWALDDAGQHGGVQP